MKKFRGQKRYYRNLKRRVNTFRLDLDEGHWYDMWHTHIDWAGYSNLGIKHRRQHLELLFQLYRSVLNQVNEYSGRYQTWLIIQEDGSQDAAFFHTPNPNNENFPIQFKEVKWGMVAPEIFRDLVLNDLDIGLSENEQGEKYYFCRSPKHGEFI